MFTEREVLDERDFESVFKIFVGSIKTRLNKAKRLLRIPKLSIIYRRLYRHPKHGYFAMQYPVFMPFSIS